LETVHIATTQDSNQLLCFAVIHACTVYIHTCHGTLRHCLGVSTACSILIQTTVYTAD